MGEEGLFYCLKWAESAWLFILRAYEKFESRDEWLGIRGAKCLVTGD